MERKANQAIIRKILLTDWDPIGVSDIPEAADEYDTYADTVFSMIVNQNASVDDVAQYLFKVATERMGLSYPHWKNVATRQQEQSLHLDHHLRRHAAKTYASGTKAVFTGSLHIDHQRDNWGGSNEKLESMLPSGSASNKKQHTPISPPATLAKDVAFPSRTKSNKRL